MQVAVGCGGRRDLADGTVAVRLARSGPAAVRLAQVVEDAAVEERHDMQLTARAAGLGDVADRAVRVGDARAAPRAVGVPDVVEGPAGRGGGRRLRLQPAGLHIAGDEEVVATGAGGAGVDGAAVDALAVVAVDGGDGAVAVHGGDDRDMPAGRGGRSAVDHDVTGLRIADPARRPGTELAAPLAPQAHPSGHRGVRHGRHPGGAPHPRGEVGAPLLGGARPVLQTAPVGLGGTDLRVGDRGYLGPGHGVARTGAGHEGRGGDREHEEEVDDQPRRPGEGGAGGVEGGGGSLRYG